jgi:hypothetical protein
MLLWKSALFAAFVFAVLLVGCQKTTSDAPPPDTVKRDMALPKGKDMTREIPKPPPHRAPPPPPGKQ